MLFTLAEQGAARDEVERWFERAVEHNPWNYDAHWHRTRYLLRHVSAGDALEFARQTRASNDWQGRLPFVLVDAHLLAGGFRAHQRFNEHLADPAVWAEVSQVYEEYLKRYPGSARDRSSYANFAARAGKWDVAARQLEILGADAVMERFNGRQDYDYLKRKAAAGAGGEDRK
jgi:hypothetical protein